MTSSQFVLAYHSKRELSDQSLELRSRAAREYAASLHRVPSVVEHSAVGGHTGILAWLPAGDSVGWPQLAVRGDSAAAWIGIPEHDAMSGNSADAIQMAHSAVQPGFDIDSFGAPYACFYRSNGELFFVNDSLGLARIYEFDFDDMVVWATRPGLAHVFAAVSAEKNDAAWSGMATLGWNAGGSTHIGSGAQIPGSTRITASSEGGVVREDNYADWIHGAPEKGSSWAEASEGMARTMSLGHYFKNSPIADLSGGKDSRLLAAAALKSGVTETVRTVRTDHGEVETAERLVDAYPGPITHLVTEVSQPKTGAVEMDLESHVAATIIGNEGATVASTALRGPTFSGYVSLTGARFNGHGGEALHGGEYCGGAWKEKLAGRGISGALERMVAMINVARGTSDHGRESAVEAVRKRLETGAAMGIDTAYGLLNYFYSAERMPLWASSSPNRSMITPYYSSGLLHHIGRTYTEETNFSKFYFEILGSLVPAWTEVPFYRPSGGSRRASKYFWENYDWAGMREFVLSRADASENFDPNAIVSLVEDVEAGTETKRIEVSLSRFIWEVSLDSVLCDINKRVDALKSSLAGSVA